MPFTPHTMLTHQWKNSSACWCRHPKTCLPKIDHDKEKSFAWIMIIVATPPERTVHDTKSTQVGLAMTTSANMQTPSTINTMSICQREDCKGGGGRTWVCFCETWNPTFLMMVTKRIHTTSCEAIFSPPCTQWKRWIPVGSKAWLQM
jgi:hypothetical protein